MSVPSSRRPSFSSPRNHLPRTWPLALMIPALLLAAALTACQPKQTGAAPVVPSSSPTTASPQPSEAPSPSPSPETVSVPTVVGSGLASARRRLTVAGFEVEVSAEVSSTARPGTVVDQNPAGLEQAARGSLVSLIVAKAPPVLPPPGSVKCAAQPLMGVYHPYRLRVLARCRWFVGTVVAVRPEDDGDHHIDVAPAPGYGGFLNQGDRASQHGGLLLEIMPGQRLPIPFVGERIAALGTWVYDTHHGWNELHPVWAIRYLDSGRLVRALPPVPPRYNPDEGGDNGGGGGGGGNGGGGSCDSHYIGVCLHDGIGDYDCAGGSGNGPNYVKGPFRVVGGDPFGLDSDHDGIGCE